MEKELQLQEEKKKMRELEKQVDKDNVQREAELSRLLESTQKEVEKQRKMMVGEELKNFIQNKQ